MTERKYRLVTRADFDGLVCAALLQELGLVDDLRFVRPKDMQDGVVLITDNDVTCNLPWVPDVHLAFDHHASEAVRLDGDTPSNLVLDPAAPSAARVVWDHYGGTSAFPRIPEALMGAVDKGDAARFDRDDILKPKGWALVNFLLDPRTGVEQAAEFELSENTFHEKVVGLLRRGDLKALLADPDMRARAEVYLSQQREHAQVIKRRTTVMGNVAVCDMRAETEAFAGNRFVIYALYPEADVSIQVVWGREQYSTVLAVGKSVLNRSNPVHLGELLLRWDGGGHANAGTCEVDNEDADLVLGELVEALQH